MVSSGPPFRPTRAAGGALRSYLLVLGLALPFATVACSSEPPNPTGCDNCAADEVCRLETRTCVPKGSRSCPADKDCTGLKCGKDPVCGLSCGDCKTGESCVSGSCRAASPVCPAHKDCTGRVCGKDPHCGLSCGECGSGERCEAGQCRKTGPSCPADKDCSNRKCGKDPVCGLSCGSCGAGESCEGGRCVVLVAGPVQISKANNHRYPSVVASAPDRILAVWEGGGRIQYVCFNGRKWSAPRPVPGREGQRGTTEQNARVVLGPGPKHRIHASWSSGLGSAREVFWSAYSGDCDTGSWAPPEKVTAKDSRDRSSPYPSVGVDQNDVPCIMWSQAKFKKNTVKCSKEPIDPVCCTGFGSSCQPKDMICHSGGCLPETYFEHHACRTGPAGARWPKPQDLTPRHSVLSHHGAVFVRRSDDIHSVYLHAWPNFGDRKIFYSHWNGKKWNGPQYTGLRGHCPDVQAGPSYVHAIVNAVLYTRKKYGSSTWSPPIRIGSGTLDFATLRVDTKGGLHAAWPNASDLRIHYAVGDAAKGTWKPGKPIHSMKDGQSPVIALTNNGYTHLVWTVCANPSCSGGGDYGKIMYMRTRYQDL